MSASSRRLTGGIDIGKTTFSRYTYGTSILDADLYAREAVAPRSPVLAEIFKRYSDRVQSPDGCLDRQALGEIVFNDSPEKGWLEAKIHPYLRDRFDRELEQLTADTVVLVIPLLFEAKMTDLVTEIWVVRYSWQEQIRRVIQSDRVNEQQAQFPLESKVAAADVVLDNSTLDSLHQQINKAVRRFAE